MKFFPRQTECPYCHTVYRYQDLRGLSRKKTADCYHCHKKMKIQKTSMVILALEILLLYVLVDFLAIIVVRTVNVFTLFAINLVPAIVAALLYPYYIELKKSETNE